MLLDLRAEDWPLSIAATAADAARAEATRIGGRNGGGPPEVPESGLTFWDLLDVVNPLQHIPVVNTIYRAVTGDEIRAPARIAGGTLYGGVIGLVASVASAAIKEETGRDPGEHMMALLGPESKPAPRTTPGTMLAQAAPPPPPPPPPDVPAPAAAPVRDGAASAGIVADGGGQRAFKAPSRMTEPTGRFFPVPARPMGGPMPALAEDASIKDTTAKDVATKDVAAKDAATEDAPARTIQAAQEWPPGGPPALPREFVADAMMTALDKYQRTARLPGAARTMPLADGRL